MNRVSMRKEIDVSKKGDLRRTFSSISQYNDSCEGFLLLSERENQSRNSGSVLDCCSNICNFFVSWYRKCKNAVVNLCCLSLEAVQAEKLGEEDFTTKNRSREFFHS